METITRAMPPQKLAFKEKGTAWREQCVDAIDAEFSYNENTSRSSSKAKLTNYNLMNSIFDAEDTKYVLDPYNIGDEYGGTPAKIRDINLVRERVMRLAGEELIRPFDFMVAAIGGNAVSIRQEKKRQDLIELAQHLFKQEIGQVEEGEEGPKFKTFEDIEKYYNTGYKDIREQWASDILQRGFHSERFKATFQEGFQHGLISGEEVYYVGIEGSRPKIRVVNPLYFSWHKSSENVNIQDAERAREERWLTVSEIIDEFAEFLTEEQIRDLDEGSISNRTSGRNMQFPGYAYSMDRLGDRGYREENDGRLIRVVIATWKSMQRIGFYTTVDQETGETIEDIVDESFRLTKEQKANGDLLEWQWITQVWQGVKIGHDIYVDINPLDNQMRSQENPSECKLPYIGAVYNNLNTDSRSFVDLLKPHQYLYNVVWYRLETEIARAKGKKMVFDLAQLPKSKGIPMKKWLYYFDTMGIAFINSHEEGEEGASAGVVSKFNQYQAIDMTLSNTIGQYIGILDKVEQLMDKVSGMNPQQLGSTHHMETATGVNTAVLNSSYITEHYFTTHEEIKQAVLNQFIETSKYAYSGGAVMHYVTSDLVRVAVEIDGEKYIDSDYGVFVTNAPKEKRQMQEVKQLAMMALQQDKASLLDAISVVKATSMGEVTRTLSASAMKEQQQAEERFQQEQETQRQASEAMLTNAREERQFKQTENQLNRENEIRKAYIQAVGFNEDKDMNDNGIPDVIEYGKDAIAAITLSSKRQIEDDKMLHASSEKAKDRELEREKIASKERIEKERNKTELKNPVSGERNGK